MGDTLIRAVAYSLGIMGSSVTAAAGLNVKRVTVVSSLAGATLRVSLSLSSELHNTANCFDQWTPGLTDKAIN